jgi:pSer/pThr/pTyr-binding forkhead associated (FHA) protein
MTDLLVFALRALFALLLYAFLWRVGRVAWRELQALAQPPPAAAAPQAFLVVISAPGPEPQLGVRVPLLPLTTIGRSAQQSLVLADPSVSGEHAQLELRDGRWWLEDLDSTNGTWVNGRRLTQPAALQSGQTFQCAHTVLRLEGG